MSSIVIYMSRQGATKQYAEWIAQCSDAKVFEAEKCPSEEIEKATNIIVGSGIFAGKWAILPFLKANQRKLESKKLAFFIVGLNPPNLEKFADLLKQGGVDLPKAKLFSFKGGLDYPKLSFGDKIIQNIVYLAVIKFNKSQDSEVLYLKQNFFKGFALMKKEYVSDLVDFIK